MVGITDCVMVTSREAERNYDQAIQGFRTTGSNGVERLVHGPTNEAPRIQTWGLGWPYGIYKELCKS